MAGSIRTKTDKQGREFFEVVMEFRDPATGKRVQRSKSFRKEREAKKYLASYQVEQEKGTDVPPSRLTLAGLLQRWLEQYARPHVGAKTYVDYEVVVRRHIVPALGGMKVQALRASHLDTFYADKIKAGASPTLVGKCHQRIVQALKYACRLGIIAVNHAENATPPPIRKKEMHVWTEEQSRRFLSVIAESAYGYLWLAFLATGMRRGEVLGIRWKDVDAKRNTIQVCQTVGIEDHQAMIKPMPKNDSSRRTVAVDPALIEALKQHRARQNEQRLRLGDAWTDYDLVFPSAVGTPIWPDNITRDYNRLVEKAGVLRIRIHDLRHTYATVALKNGANLLAVSRQLGHARPSTTSDIYGHIDSEMQQEASAAVASALFGKKADAM
jgi:integrase